MRCTHFNLFAICHHVSFIVNIITLCRFPKPHSPGESFDSRWNSNLSLLHRIDNSTQNYYLELSWNLTSIQNYNFELNWQFNAANSSWNFILNQMSGINTYDIQWSLTSGLTGSLPNVDQCWSIPIINVLPIALLNIADQCRPMPINADQFLSIGNDCPWKVFQINAWVLISIDRHGVLIEGVL